jgi:hypothetical protein
MPRITPKNPDSNQAIAINAKDAPKRSPITSDTAISFTATLGAEFEVALMRMYHSDRKLTGIIR